MSDQASIGENWTGSPQSSYGPKLMEQLEAVPNGSQPDGAHTEELTGITRIPHTNWVDPDILAYNEQNKTVIEDHKAELDFKKFFEEGWFDPKYDHLRERWDPTIHDEDPYGRLMGKVALWNLTRYMEIQERLKAKNE